MKKKELTEQELQDRIKEQKMVMACYEMYSITFGDSKPPEEKRIREIVMMMKRHDCAAVNLGYELLIDQYGVFYKFPFKDFFNPDIDIVNMKLETFQRNEGEPCPVRKWLQEH